MLHIRKICIGFIILPVLLLSSGCSIGPQSMKYSSRQYNNALLRHSEEQLLLNIIRTLYGEPPLFMEAGPIQTSFIYSARADISSTIQAGTSSIVGPGGGLQYSEQPSIAFSALRGEKFATQMLRPMSMEQFAHLLRSMRTDLVMLVAVQRFGDLSNRLYGDTSSDPYFKTFSPGRTRVCCADFMEFKKLVKAWDKLYANEQLEITLTCGNPINIGEIGKAHELKCSDQISAVKEGFAYYKDDAITPTAASDRTLTVIRESAAASDSGAPTPTPTSTPDTREYELKRLGSPAILIKVHFHTPTPICTVAPMMAAGNRESDEGLLFRDGEDYKTKIKELLGVEPEEEKGFYTIKLVSDECAQESPGSDNSRKGEVKVQLRSFLHSLAFISQAIDIPQTDVEEVLGLENWLSNREFEVEKERLCKSMNRPKAGNAEVRNWIKKFPLEKKNEDYITGIMQNSGKTEKEKLGDVVEYVTACREQAVKEKEEYETARECLKGVMDIKNETSLLGYERKKPFVKTRYNGHEFYISSYDQGSRGTFMILSLIFELMSGDVRMFGPLPTINVGAK